MTDTHTRPSWDEYFIEIMDAVGKRATCDRGRSGCVIVKEKHILATGYVGAPAGVAHCDDVGHELSTVVDENGLESKHCIRTAHAEQNAIVHASRVGTSLLGSTLYSHMAPCYACAKMIINAGIVRVVSKKDYHRASRAKDIFKEAGVEFELLNTEMETYRDM